MDKQGKNIVQRRLLFMISLMLIFMFLLVSYINDEMHFTSSLFMGISLLLVNMLLYKLEKPRLIKVKGKKVKQVRFADYGWNVELTWPKRFNVQFGVNGGPTYSGTWVVQHSEFTGISCTVAVQPVTGRIVVSESE
mgnify:CR=1 FL=1